MELDTDKKYYKVTLLISCVFLFVCIAVIAYFNFINVTSIVERNVYQIDINRLEEKLDKASHHIEDIHKKLFFDETNQNK